MSTVTFDLPVGPRPDWELENGEEKRKVSESYSIFYSLRQSRERWISATFPRFSTKASRGKVIHHTPPPHTIQTRGKCDLEIGPHIFQETVFYEVHYLPQASSTASENHSSSTFNSPWPNAPQSSSSTSVSGTQVMNEVKTSPAPSSAVTAITPTLINQVNLAASANPILANLLQLAAAGSANPEQLKTLGLLIQSLAAENAPAASPQMQKVSMAPVPSSHPSHAPRPFDFVLEFRECPSDRWVFPRGPVVYERVPNHLDSLSFDIAIQTRLPFRKITPEDSAKESIVDPENDFSQVVGFQLKKAPSAIWDTITRWVGDDSQIRENKKILNGIVSPERMYLGHRLSPGTLLSQLQTAALSPYQMKPLRSHAKAMSRKNRTKRQATTVTAASQSRKEEKSSSGSKCQHLEALPPV